MPEEPQVDPAPVQEEPVSLDVLDAQPTQVFEDAYGDDAEPFDNPANQVDEPATDTEGDATDAPLDQDKEEEPEVSTEEGEEDESDEVVVTKADLKKLLEAFENGIDLDVPQPQPTTQQPQVEKPAEPQAPAPVAMAEIPWTPLTEQEHDMALSSPDGFDQVVKARVEGVVNHVARQWMQSLPQQVYTQSAIAVDNLMQIRDFMVANPEIQTMPKAFMKSLGKAKVHNPDGDIAALLDFVKTDLATAVALQEKITKSTKKDVRPQRGRTRLGGTGSRPFRPTSEPNRVNDPTVQALQDILSLQPK